MPGIKRTKQQRIELACKVLHLVRIGLSVRESCKRLEIPRESFLSWVRTIREVRVMYADALKQNVDKRLKINDNN